MALSRHHQSISNPLSVEEIVSIAQDFEFSTNRPLKGWIRSAQLLLTEAAICEQDGDVQMAYLYLYRHAELVIGKLPQHPEFKDPRFKADVALAQKTVQKNLTKLEQWKPRIKREHERFEKAKERRNAERQRSHEERPAFAGGSHRGSIGSDDGMLHDSAHSLNANEHSRLAVDLAHQELRRRDAARHPTGRADIQLDTVASRRRGTVQDPGESASSRDEDYNGGIDGVREAGRYLHRNQSSTTQVRSSQQRTTSTSYRYPSVPAKEGTIDWKMPSLSSRKESGGSHSPPMIPGKEMPDDWPLRRNMDAPPIPSKSRESTTSKPSTTAPSPPTIPSSPHRSSSKYTFKPSAFTESGAPLRPVLLPPDLRTTFLNLAHPNTARNLETCGILCGTLISNALFINHLIIPDQQSTSDTCDTTEEGDNDLFDYCDAHELLVCGWIHTHPSQSCFLSSRDLHTSSGYQIMLPEAIAIVCAPRQNPDWGIFRLTDPPGLKHVLNCQQKGLFHPHSETDLYTDAVKPGHVVEGPGLKFKVVDLRKSWL